MANFPESWSHIPNIECFPSFINYIENKKKILKPFYIVKLLFNLSIAAIDLDFLLSKKIKKMIKLIINADVIYSCGGGNFYSTTFFASDFFLNSLTILFAGWLHKSIIMLPQSFGPFYKKFHLLLLRICLKYPQKIYTREKISFDLLKSNQIPDEKIKVIPDLALGLNSVQLNNKPCLEESKSLKVGITIINRGNQFAGFKSQDIYVKEIINAIQFLLLQKNISIYFFVQCYGPSNDQNDNLITTEIYNHFARESNRVYLLNHYKSFEEIVIDMSRMDLLIASRMHTAIFGIINQIPTILIGYQHKAKGLFTMLHVDEYFVSIDTLSANFLINKAQELLALKNNFNYKINRELPNIQNEINNLPLKAI